MFKKIWKFLYMPVAIGIPLWLMPRRRRAGGCSQIHPQPMVFPHGADRSDDPWIQRLVERDRIEQRKAAQDAGWQRQLAQERGEGQDHEGLGAGIMSVAEALFANDLCVAHGAAGEMLQAAQIDALHSVDSMSMMNDTGMQGLGLHNAGTSDFGMHSGGVGIGVGGML
jgi:hypothetical protein